jgi:hypothetical protein
MAKTNEKSPVLERQEEALKRTMGVLQMISVSYTFWKVVLYLSNPKKEDYENKMHTGEIVSKYQAYLTLLAATKLNQVELGEKIFLEFREVVKIEVTDSKGSGVSLVRA